MNDKLITTTIIQLPPQSYKTVCYACDVTCVCFETGWGPRGCYNMSSFYIYSGLGMSFGPRHAPRQTSNLSRDRRWRKTFVFARLLWRFERLSLRGSAFDSDLRVILKSSASVRARLFPIFVNKWFSDLVRSTQDTLCNMSKALANLFSYFGTKQKRITHSPLDAWVQGWALTEFRV